MKYEMCDIALLQEREESLIRHFNPILNGEFCNPEKKVLLIEDCLFVHKNKKCLELRGDILFDRGIRCGFINSVIASWQVEQKIFTYHFKTGEMETRNWSLRHKGYIEQSSWQKMKNLENAL